MEFFELVLGRTEARPVYVPELAARIPLALAQATEKRVFDFYWLQSQTLIHAAMDVFKSRESSTSPILTVLAPAFSDLLQLTPCDSHASSKNSNPISTGLTQDLQELSHEVVILGTQLKKALSARLTHVGALRSELKRADQAVFEGLRETSSERRELFREAAELYTQVTAAKEGANDALSMLLLGWLKWRLDGQVQESAELWQQAILERGAVRDPIMTLLVRLSAMASAELENPEEAFIKLIKMGGDHIDSFALVEAGSYAWKAGLQSEAKQAILSAVARHPILIVWLSGQDFAEPARWAA